MTPPLLYDEDENLPLSLVSDSVATVILLS